MTAPTHFDDGFVLSSTWSVYFAYNPPAVPSVTGGAAGTSSHFDKVPVTHAGDMAEVAKVMVIYALLAQDPDWRAAYL